MENSRFCQTGTKASLSRSFLSFSPFFLQTDRRGITCDFLFFKGGTPSSYLPVKVFAEPLEYLLNTAAALSCSDLLCLIRGCVMPYATA